VGYHLAKELAELGATLTICDSKPDTAGQFGKEFSATVVDKENIFDVDCDVFAPCARGGILNEDTIGRLKASIVAGAANNQLAASSNAQLMHDRGIVYAPDYVINAGGLIQVSLDDEQVINQKVNGIYDALLNIFTRSATENLPTSTVADEIAKEIIDSAK